MRDDAVVTAAPDAHYADPRLVALYDRFEGDRSDLETYLGIAAELGVSSVIDVGCGTGSLCCLLAQRGLRVTGVDPAGASLDVARVKPGAEGVRLECGGAAELPGLGLPAAELATMTGNAAQAIVGDAEWQAALAGIRAVLAPGGVFAFETRDPSVQAWREWTPERTRQRCVLPEGGAVESWVEVIDVAPPLVSFRGTFAFEPSGEILHSDSTLRFRERDEVCASLTQAGFSVLDVRDAPDRPGREFVFLARRASLAAQPSTQ